MKVCKIEECESTDLPKRSAMCKTHHNEYTRAHYKANRQYYLDKAARRNREVYPVNREVVIDYLRTHPCVDCGNGDIEVLQFDHRDRLTKTAEVGRLLTCSLNRLMTEIEKCDVRCANCHQKKSRRQLGWWLDSNDGTMDT